MINEAIEIALQAHYNQHYGKNNPYIIHPLSIMLQFSDESERIVAVLHDVIEDSEYTLDDLKDEGFSDRVIEALDALTRRPNEPYLEYIHRCIENPLAKNVKLADLNFNMRNCMLNGNLNQYIKYLFAKAEILNE